MRLALLVIKTRTKTSLQASLIPRGCLAHTWDCSIIRSKSLLLKLSQFTPMEDNTSSKKKVSFLPQNESHFNTTKHALTPSLSRIIAPQYQKPEERSAHCVAPPSTISRPNYEDILRRVSIVVHQHIQRCEQRLALATPETFEKGLFRASQMEKFSEELFTSPQYVYHFVRAPISRLGFCYGIRKLSTQFSTPSLSDVHVFLSDLFIKAQLSAECSIVCLIYMERLMETANVPIVGNTWRPCLLCSLLLASKVWQDLGSWNSEISQVYPQYSVQNINKLEGLFCKELNWNLYISSSVYAKYYFALRSLSEKSDFRRNYNVILVNAPGAELVAERSEDLKQATLVTFTLSRSL